MALLLALPFSAGGVQLTRNELERASTEALARMTLTLADDLLPKVTTHRLENQPRILATDMTSYGAIRFFMQSTQAKAGICRRDTWYVPLQRLSGQANGGYDAGIASGPTVQLAIANDCRAVRDAAIGWYQSQGSVDDAVIALLNLLAIQQQVRQGIALPFELECRSVLTDTDPCKAGALHVLRTLPLDRLLMIDPDKDLASGATGWRLVIAPDGPGRSFFQIWLPEGDPTGQKMRLTWMAPPPF